MMSEMILWINRMEGILSFILVFALLWCELKVPVACLPQSHLKRL